MVVAVSDAEGWVAVLDRIDDDAERHGVGELLESDVLALHLAPDRIGGLFAPGDIGAEAVFGQRAAQALDDPTDDVATTGAQELQPIDDGSPPIRIQPGECPIRTERRRVGKTWDMS